MSIVTKSIVNADAEARYLSPGELDRIKKFRSIRAKTIKNCTNFNR
jgi:allophycocyanin alpha subunit